MSARPRSFPRHFNGPEELRVYWLSQKNAWNTQTLWSSIVETFDTEARLRKREIHKFVDNCSAHSIDFTSFENYKNHFLPPHMTSILQPVDCAVGRSFKCALSRLIVLHVLDYVDRMHELPEADRRPFKINEIITAYTAVRLIAEAWDLVPRRAILKVWLKTGLLSPHQIREVEDLLMRLTSTVEPASKPQKGTVTKTEEAANILRFSAVSRLGDEWLGLREETAERRESGQDTTVVDTGGEDPWDLENIGFVRTATNCLKERDEFAELSADLLDPFFDLENGTNTSCSVSEEKALYHAIQSIEGEQDYDTDDDEGLESPGTSTVSGSKCRFVRTSEELSKELELLVTESHDIRGEGRGHALLRLVDAEIMKAREWLRNSRTQTHITDFFVPGISPLNPKKKYIYNYGFS